MLFSLLGIDISRLPDSTKPLPVPMLMELHHVTGPQLTVLPLNLEQAALTVPRTTLSFPSPTGNSTWLAGRVLGHKPGVGVTKPISSIPLFSDFFTIVKHTLDIENHIYIGQVLLQLSCGDTCQIWLWFKESKRYIYKIENFDYREINKQRFSNPHPWTDLQDWAINIGQGRPVGIYYILSFIDRGNPQHAWSNVKPLI